MSDRKPDAHEAAPSDENANDAEDGDRDGASDEQSNGANGRNDAADDKKKPSLFRKPLFWIILIVVVAVLVIGGVLYWLHARQFESTDNAFVDAHIVRIAPEVGGTLTAVADVDNRHVKAGRLLAVIQANGREAQVAEAQANVAQAVATYRQSLAEIDSARASRAQAAAQARAPLANAAKAQADLARYFNLQRLDPNAVAATQLDQARAQARATAAEAQAAQRAVQSADAQVAVAQRQANANQTVIGARRAAVQQADATVSDLRITAPVDGQVVNRQVNVGSYVGPGSQLMAIVPDRMWVTANFKETQLELMRIGQSVEIRVDAYPGVKFRGHVDSIQRGAGQAFALLPPQNATGNYVKVVQRVPVRIEFDRGRGDPDPRRYPIGPGMSVVPTVKVR